ncbi:MAG: hypothetical protein H6812_08440 [Phycisphaeraceae bacterium]|nr:hypothetical protein [Phycisphaerales bacterium]MCB9843272.1 hypothetical protein [Phycisphaeraceae bacterium]
MTSGAPIPPGLAIPIAIVGMIVVAAHAQALAKAPGVPESRRRVRLANAVLMLLTIPLLTAGFSLISSVQQPRVWVMVWLVSFLLVGMILLLAVIDTLNTVRIGRERRRELRDSLSAYRADIINLARNNKAKHPAQSTSEPGDHGA